MRRSALARLGVMAVLIMTLLIPLGMVASVVSERASRRGEAVTEIGATWGGPQTLTGPVLTVPYTLAWKNSSGQEQRTIRRAHFLPRDLMFDATLETERRARGIFEVNVYHTKVTVRGRFVRSDLAWVRPTPTSIEWGDAVLSVGISDPRALTERAAIDWNGQSEPFASGVADVGIFSNGIQAPARGIGSIAAGTEIPFSFTIAINGTRDIRFIPAAEETTVNLTSSWPHPSFVGGPLPQTRTTGANGFTARWRAPDFGRPYPARWMCSDFENNREVLLGRVNGSAFGVSLVQPVDIYQQAERAVKYAVLFLVLTFLVFFLWEVFRSVLVHPVQYAFVGFALCLFYLLLVSISEHAGFDVAYGVSAAATTLAIGGYARAVLRGTGQGASVVASLTTLYGFLYLLLRLEDYALLAGSIGLFLVLSAVMFITRTMNWYELRLGNEEVGKLGN
jgi:inner membrane protein